MTLGRQRTRKGRSSVEGDGGEEEVSLKTMVAVQKGRWNGANDIRFDGIANGKT